MSLSSPHPLPWSCEDALLSKTFRNCHQAVPADRQGGELSSGVSGVSRLGRTERDGGGGRHVLGCHQACNGGKALASSPGLRVVEPQGNLPLCLEQSHLGTPTSHTLRHPGQPHLQETSLLIPSQLAFRLGLSPGWPTWAGRATAMPGSPPPSSVPRSGQKIPLSQTSS